MFVREGVKICKLIYGRPCVKARLNRCAVVGFWNAGFKKSGARRLPADAARAFTLKKGWTLIIVLRCAVHMMMMGRVSAAVARGCASACVAAMQWRDTQAGGSGSGSPNPDVTATDVDGAAAVEV